MKTPILKAPLRVLHLEDNLRDRELVAEALAADGLACQFTYASTQQEFEAALAKDALDLILSDYTLPSYSGMKALTAAHSLMPEVPFIFVSGTIGEERAVESLKRGATDYVLKERPERLAPIVRRAVCEAQLREARQRAEEALRANETILRSFFDSGGGMRGIVELADDDILHVSDNAAAAAFHGQTKDAMRHQRDSELGVPEPVRRLWVDRLAESVRTGAPVCFEYAWPASAGALWLCVTLSPLGVGAEDRPSCAYLVQDISERKRAEASLQLFRSLLDRSTDLIEVADPETGRLLDVNETACAALGYRREEMLALRVFDVDPTVNPGVLATVGAELRKTGAATWQGLHRRKDGSSFPVETNLKYVRLDRDYAVAVVRDVTERRRVQEEVRLLNVELEQRVKDRTRELEDANQELESFSYSVSHDLRAPLRALDGYARILNDDYTARLDAEGRRVLGVISGEAQRMGELIEALLNFSRLGRQTLAKREINMTALADAVARETAAPQPQRNVQWEVESLLPAHGDEILVRQVWVNLITNALKFTQARDPAVIRIGSRMENGEVIYHVADNGAGFDMRYVAKLFGVFQRLHKVQDFPGTGIGLALVQRIIHRHGGRVWAEGKVNEGATFYFSLPAER